MGDFRNGMTDMLADIESSCTRLELTASVATTKKMKKLVVNQDCTFKEFGELANELQDRLIDEMEGRVFLSLSLKEAEQYMNPTDGWREVIDRFPDSVTDVEEASKCFACGRYAAAVHHTLMVVEHGLIGLGKQIGVNDPKSGWTAVTNRLQVLIYNTKPIDRPAYFQQHFLVFEQIHATIEALKNARRAERWRILGACSSAL